MACHKEEDELFYVQKGRLEMRFRKALDVTLSLSKGDTTEFEEWSEFVNEGEIIIVPKGV